MNKTHLNNNISLNKEKTSILNQSNMKMNKNNNRYKHQNSNKAHLKNNNNNMMKRKKSKRRKKSKKQNSNKWQNKIIDHEETMGHKKVIKCVAESSLITECKFSNKIIMVK